ncbi:MAG: Hsp20/alpha crystallin family protein [Chloroflexi bacterium]|nr:Hsp20/alpha crystallin family protein [Chloroflexota bacterium]
MSITRFRPPGDIATLRDAMDRPFEDSFVRPGVWANGAALGVPVDLWEAKDAYHLRADVPGTRPEDIDINVTHDTVTIGGEIKPHAPRRDRREQGRRDLRERRAPPDAAEVGGRPAEADQGAPGGHVGPVVTFLPVAGTAGAAGPARASQAGNEGPKK